MRYNRALLIIGQDMLSPSHHRGEHLVRCLARHFAQTDMVSVAKMYDGPGTDPVWKKGLLGIRDILFKRVKPIPDGNMVHLVVRFPHLPTTLDYLLRDFWTYASLIKHLQPHYDLGVLAHPRLAFVALRLKRLGKVDTLIYDDWDYYPSEFPAVPFWHQIMDYRERACVHGADGVVSVSSGLQALRRQQGARCTALVPNGVDYAFFQPAQDKKPHPPTILYMGTLGAEWGTDLPILALPIIRESLPQVRYAIVGTGPDENRLRAMVTERGMQDHVFFFGRQKYQDLPRFLAEADIGVATSRDNDFRRYACPLKVFEYMAAGLPVIGTQFGETQIIIEKARAGATVPFSPQAFAAAALQLFCNRSHFEACSANAVALARQHEWARLFEQELDFIRQVAS